MDLDDISRYISRNSLNLLTLDMFHCPKYRCRRPSETELLFHLSENHINNESFCCIICTKKSQRELIKMSRHVDTPQYLCLVGARHVGIISY